MATQAFFPGPTPRTVQTPAGKVVPVPAGWELLPPGDAALTSGTVARTKRIPIEHRAEAAVIAWLRHQTTGYDSMKIARVKGQRREVRRMLAQRSKELLAGYRRGEAVRPGCPLAKALDAPVQLKRA